MKAMLMAFLVAVSPALYAGCEAVAVEGGHTALTVKEAKAGALEEVRDACPASAVSSETVECVKVEGEIGVQGKPAVRCMAEAYCNVCGEDLNRAHEAKSE